MTNLAAMVQTVRQYGVADIRVVQAMGQLDRRAFVPPQWQTSAYEDLPLPIGFGQTISQPYTVARMIELLIASLSSQKMHRSRVLEIGTGSGWEAAILAKLFKQVYSVEIVEQLAERAGKVISDLGITNIEIKVGDGKLGWPDHAPYQGIIVAADASEVPPALIEQLVDGGRIVLPVKDEMRRGIKSHGEVAWESFGSFSFVPLV